MPDLKKLELTPSLSIIIAGVIIAGAIVYSNMQRPVAAGAPAETGVNVPAPSAKDHIIGSASAPVVLIEYSDFQCPYCGMAYPTLKKIVTESNGQIAWVHRNFPLDSIHPQARPAALAAECIAEQLGNDGFWKFADTIYTNQKPMAPAYYAKVAGDLGANVSAFTACVASEKYASKLDQEYNDAVANGGQGTPYTIVYGKGQQKAISGAVPYAQFMSVIKALQ